VLTLARQFFALPAEAKNEISQFKSPQFRGYSRLGGELTNGKASIGASRSTSVRSGRSSRAPRGTGDCRGPTCGRPRRQPSGRHSRGGTRRCPVSDCVCCGTGRCRWEPRRMFSTPPSRISLPR
jgi:hypothetical protein